MLRKEKQKPKEDKTDNPNRMFANNTHKHHHHDVIQEVNITIDNSEKNEDGVVNCFKSLAKCFRKS